MDPNTNKGATNPFDVLIVALKYLFFWVIVEFSLLYMDFERQVVPSAERGWIGAEFVSAMFLLNWGVHSILDRVLGGGVPWKNRSLHYLVRLGAVAVGDGVLLWLFFGFTFSWFFLLFFLTEIKFVSLMTRWEKVG